MAYSPITVLVLTWAPAVLSCAVMSLRVWYTSWRIGRWIPTFSELAGLLSIPWLVAANINGTWLISKELKYNLDNEGTDGYILLALLHGDILREYFKLAFVNTVSYYCLAWLFKAMFLSTFFSLQRQFTTRFRFLFWCCVSYNCCAFITTIIALFAWCRPLSHAWGNPVTGQWCDFQSRHIILIGMICNVTSDLFIFTFAILLIRTLTIRRGEYWAIAFIMFLGCFSIAGCVTRFSITWTLSGTSTTTAELTVAHASQVWTEIELATGQIAACLPSFRAIIRQWLQTHKMSPWSIRVRGQGGSDEQQVVESLVLDGSQVVTEHSEMRDVFDARSDLAQRKK